MLEKITFCIPTKNNLRYLKGSVTSIKENSVADHDILVFVDSDTDGTCEWLEETGVKYLKNKEPNPTGIANAYNMCINAAKTEVVCAFHADMIMGKSFDVNLLKHLSSKRMVAATRIEPPLHPAGKEKIVEHFGMYPEDFKKDAFNAYVQNLVVKNKDAITKGMFAPWICYRHDILEIGGMDRELCSYYEDSDLFQRMILNGCTMVQAWDALVYHFTCRGGQFADGVEKPTTDQRFIQMRNRSAQLYMKKWGSWIKNDEYQHPVLVPKYDIGFVLPSDPSPELFNLLNLFGGVYIRMIPDHDIVISFSETELKLNAQENLQFIQNINAIIAESVTPNSEMEWGPFKLTSKEVKDVSKNLIKI